MSNPVLVVMAAGMGSRYGGLKQIDPVGPNGQIIMNYSIYDAWKAGFRHVVFIIKEDLLESFKEKIGASAEKLMKVSYVFQSMDNLPQNCNAPVGRVKPFGTGHAVYCLKDKINEPFAVINADDFYGAEAFKKIYDYLVTAKDDEKFRYCMVGYPVENTLTENGTVSRGVCKTDEKDILTEIIERTSIQRINGVISDKDAGEISEGTPVSMNMWGFTPSFLGELDFQLKDFFEKQIPNNPEKAEFYLPFAVDRLIRDEKATVKVLKTSAKWFGVTYKDDKPVIVNAIAEMTENGIYPAE